MTNARDNWGDKARFGIFIVGAEVVPEAEWWAMAPPGVSIHAARVTAPAPWVGLDRDTGEIALAPDIERGAAQFTAMALDAAVLAHSSSSVAGGAGWDDAVISSLRPYLHERTAVTTNGLDCTLAMRSVGMKRPFLVFPPWFGDSTIAAAHRYFAAHGFAEASTFRHVPEERWEGVPPQDLYTKLMHIAQNVDLLHDQIISNCPGNADGVLIVGTGLRCAAIIGASEAALGRPVVTANQASLWRCLSLAGIDARIAGFGELLASDRASSRA